jgi:hypothetical protein
MSFSGLEVTAVTIEAGWKMKTLLAKNRLGVNCAAFAPADPASLVSQTIQIAQDPFYEPELV